MKLWITLSMIGAMSLAYPQAFAEGAHGVFRVVKGQVQVKSAQTGQVSRARIGLKVLPGDVITAAKDSRAKVVMVDHNEININPDSQIKIEKYEYNPSEGKKNVLLNVIYGKVRSKVEQKYDGRTSKFQVKTPSAVAGVRGTNFITGYEPTTGISKVVTFRGRVEFGLPGANGSILNAVAVNPGQMAEISKGGAISHGMVPREDFNQMDHDSSADTGDSASGGKASGATETAGASHQEGDRQPSSSSGGMTQDADLAGSPNGPLPPAPNVMPSVAPIPKVCERNCQEAIQGNAHLIIRVDNQ
jgi:hypothetical protein